MRREYFIFFYKLVKMIKTKRDFFYINSPRFFKIKLYFCH